MSDSRERDQSDKSSKRYADVSEFGDLGHLLQLHLASIGSPLQIDDLEEPKEGDWSCWASVESETRMSQVSLTSKKRHFMLDFWDRGVCLGNGYSSSPRIVAEMLDAWIAKHRTPTEIKRQFPQVEFSDDSDSYMAGAAAYVEQSWLALLQSTQEDKYSSVLEPVVSLAHSHPLLGKLMPYTSMGRLCFSQCTGYPFMPVGPVISPLSQPDENAGSAEPQYEVKNRTSEFTIKCNAAEAIEYAISCLPPDCQPAFLGTAEDE